MIVEPAAASGARPEAAAAAPTRSTARRLADSLAGARTDLAIVAAVTVLAALLRFWRLGAVPLGLHGDEAWTALDAQRILREGWIGPYVTSALGQPTGPLYVTAALFKFLPDTTFTARFSMALFGVATIPLAYAAFACMFNRTVAAFGATLLAVMMWHLHLSRTAFMVVSWPFMEVLVLWALWLAFRRRSFWLFGIAGALHGLGVYSYNAYLLFVPVPFVALAWATLYERGWRRRARFLLVDCAVFAVCALATAAPLIEYARTHGSEYRQHDRVVGLTSSSQWKDAGGPGRAKLIWNRAAELERGLILGDRPDFGDGLATAGHPAVGPWMSLLALAGLGIAIWSWRRPEYAVVLAACVVLPLGALLTVEDGLFRRTLGLAPFVALLAALPLAWIWETAWQARRRLSGRAGLAVAIGAVAIAGVSSVWQYFGPVQQTAAMRLVYPYEIDAASRYIDGLPKDTYVYFYSDRWSFDYETRRFLAPGYTGEDRSKEFGTRLPIVGGAGDPVPDRSTDVVYVFLGSYLSDADGVMLRFSGGTSAEGRRGGEVTFRAYFLPRESYVRANG